MSLIDDLDELEARARGMIEGADGTDALERARVALLGRKGDITSVMHMMGKVAPEERPVLGKRANELRRLAESMIERRGKDLRREALSSLMATEAVDVTLPGARPKLGHQHLISQIIEEIEDVFCGIGYTVESGPQVETSWCNFTALNAPMDHPSRSARDSFYIVDNAPGSVDHPEEHAHGESDVLLRTQTSPVQVRTMEKQKPPIRVIAPGRVYRSDAVDATHSPLFHQIEGLVVDRGVTMADLKGTLEMFAKRLYGEEAVVRFRPHHFPFTEPSAEMDFQCFACHGEGCRLCKGEGWIEILGCGMVHPKVLENCGIDPDVYSGYAFGVGLERITMMRYGIDDMRLLYENDLRFLKQFN